MFANQICVWDAQVASGSSPPVAWCWWGSVIGWWFLPKHCQTCDPRDPNSRIFEVRGIQQLATKHGIPPKSNTEAAKGCKRWMEGVSRREKMGKVPLWDFHVLRCFSLDFRGPSTAALDPSEVVTFLATVCCSRLASGPRSHLTLWPKKISTSSLAVAWLPSARGPFAFRANFDNGVSM